MALAGYALPFGLRQVKLTPLDDAGNRMLSEAQFLPASRTFSFSETEDFEELQGDDRTIASHGAGPVVEWELEGGGISLAVWKILSGGTITTSGTTPNISKKFTKKTSDSRPYFEVEGRAISDNGGDLHGVVYRCKADGDLEAEMANGSFLLTSASGKGYGDLTTDQLYDWIHNETAVPIVLGPPATGATAGIPGTYTPSDAALPANLAAMVGTVTASPTTAWTTGQYVNLADGSKAHWSGTAWTAGAKA